MILPVAVVSTCLQLIDCRELFNEHDSRAWKFDGGRVIAFEGDDPDTPSCRVASCPWSQP